MIKNFLSKMERRLKRILIATTVIQRLCQFDTVEYVKNVDPVNLFYSKRSN